MSSNKAVDSIKIKYIGIPNIKTQYTGDGVNCDTAIPKSCDVTVETYKAAQLLKDFPEEWEVGEDALRGRSVIKFIQDNEYRNKMVGTAEARKGVKVIYPDGSEMTYPAGTEIQVKTPENTPTRRETNG